MSRKFHLEATLEEFPLPRALENLHERGFTGRIVIRRGDITKAIFLIGGEPVNVDSTLRDETLGRFLVKKGRITDLDFDRSIQMMMEQNIQQGAALVKLGCLSPKELYHEVKAQTREKLVSAFAWTTGFLGCYQEIEFVADIYRFEMPMPAVMREGIIRFFPPGAAESQLARVSGGPVNFIPGFAERLAGFELSQKEHELLELIDGRLTLLELKNAMSSYPFAGKFLYLLFVTGLIGPDGRPEDAVRSLGGPDQGMLPVEDFLLPSADETAPEVVEEEVIEQEHEEFSLDDQDEEEDEVTPASAPPPEPPPWEAPPPGERPSLILDEESSDEVMAEGDIFAEPSATVTVFDRPREIEPPPLDDEGPSAEWEAPPPEIADGPEGEVALGGDEDETEGAGEEEVGGEEAAEPSYRDPSDILETYMQIKGRDFYELLGIGPEAGDAEVEAGYHQVFDSWDWTRFSPDLDMETMAKLEEIHTQIIRAYEALRTEKNRDAHRLKQKKTTEPDPMKDKLAAEQCLKKGLEFVRKREWPKAQQMFEQAVKASPREPEFKSYLAWTIYQNEELDPAARRQRAKAMLNEAIDLNPQMDSCHVFLGKILKDEKNFKEAEGEFKAALRANPGCREADRELKAHWSGEW